MARSEITATSSIAAAAHAIKDAVGGIFTFANAATAGGYTLIEQLIVKDIGQAMPDLDLVLFNATIGGTVTDDLPFDPTDADILNIVAVIPVGGGNWSDFTDNSVASVDVYKPVKLAAAGTSLFGALVARSSYTTIANYPQLTLVVNLD